MNYGRKILAMFLALVLVTGMLPVSAFASETKEIPEETQAVSTEESQEAPPQESTEAPTQESTEAPTQESTEAPTQESTEASAETQASPAVPPDAEQEEADVPLAGPAPTLQHGIFTYQVLKNETICITGHTDAPVAGNVNIPSQIDGLPVTEIGSSAFSQCTELTSILIPDSVTKIGEYAFSGCTALCDVHYPVSLQTCGYGSIFDGCTALTSVTVPEGVTKIPAYIFEKAPSLSDVSLPGTLQEIGNSAFSQCTELTSILIPDSVTKIGEYAFSGCTALRDVHYPASLQTCGYGSIFDGCTALTSVTVPEGVTKIPAYIFEKAPSLSDVSLPGSLETVSQYAFHQCDALSDVYYADTKTQWNNIVIERENDPLRNAVIHFNCSDSGSVDDVDLANFSVTVMANRYDSEKAEEQFFLCQGADVITEDGTVYTTGSDGSVTVPNPSQTLTFSVKGYVMRTVSLERLKLNPTVYLQKVSACPVINALWINDRDVLHEDLEVYPLSGELFEVEPEIAPHLAGIEKIVLYQEGRSLPLDQGVNRIPLTKNFDVTKDIRLVVSDPDRLDSEKIFSLQSSGSQVIQNVHFETSDKLEFVLPDDLPFPFAGSQMKIDLFERFPVAMVVENGKFYGTIGFQFGTKGTGGKGEYTWKVKNTADSVDSLLKELKNAKDTIAQRQLCDSWLLKHSEAVTMKGSVGFDLNFKLAYFMEGYIKPDGSLSLTNHGGLLFGSSGVSYTRPFMFPGTMLPCFYSVKLGGDVEGQVNMCLSGATNTFTPDAVIVGNISVTGEVGAGISSVAYVKGGITGTLMNNLNITRKKIAYYKLSGKVETFMEARLLFAVISKSFPMGDPMTFYEYPKPAAVMACSEEPGASYAYGFYDISNYRPEDLGYLASGSAFMGIQNISTFSVRKETNARPFVANAYRDARPQTASFADGTKLAVWVGYNPELSGYDALNLYYSFYRGTWSEPRPVEADGTIDGAACLKVIGDQAYLVWQDASAPAGADATPESAAHLFGISGAVFDKTSSTFQCSAITTGGLCTMPTLAGSGSSVQAVWQKNGGNDWFGLRGGNAILSSSFSGGSWTSPQIRYQGLEPILNLTCSDSGTIAYALDTDGDLNTQTDVEIFRDGTKLTDNTVLDSGAYFCGDELYWYSDGMLLCNGTPCMADGALIGSDRFQILDGNGLKVMVYAQGEGLASVLYAAYASGSGWGDPIELYRGNTHIPCFSASVTDSGTLSVLLQSQEITGDYNSQDPYGVTNLVWYNAPSLAGNLRLDDVRYDMKHYVQDQNMPFYLTVTNTAELPVEQIRLKLTDDAGAVLAERVANVNLLSGQTEELKLDYPVKEIVQNRKLTVQISAEGMQELDQTDNSRDISLCWNDLAVENVRWGKLTSGETVIHADIVNRGYDVQTNVRVELREGSAQGKLLKSGNVGNLEPFQLHHVSFSQAAGSGKIFYVCVEQREGDGNLGNNDGFIYDNSPSPTVPFVDVKPTNYFYDAVNWAVANKITMGADETHFAPNAPCIRKQVVMFLWRAYGKPEPASMKNPFVDVPHNVYEKPILWAYYAGITSGKDAVHFQPEAPCSRQQIVMFLWRAEGKPEPVSQENPFKDVYHGTFEKPILWAVENNITGGYRDGTFRPNQTCTRAQIVSFLYRNSLR